MDKKSIRILLADDHTIFREGLKTILKPVKHIEVVGAASDGEQLIHAVLNAKPDVVLTDIMMPGIDGVTATVHLSKHAPESKIIALTMYDQESLVTDMIDAGALGFLLKNATREELVTAIETVGRNTPYFCKEISDRLRNMVSRKTVRPFKPLSNLTFTEREKEIMRMLCMERTSKEIASDLRISKRTVEGYRSKIMDKIGAKSIAGVITYAVTRGIYQRD